MVSASRMARESIESLLNPSLRVSRPVAACARCRAAKVKCDGGLPACSACVRAGKGQDCSSANDEFARGKERSYVAALETTIQRLQQRLQDQQALNSDSHTRPPADFTAAAAAAAAAGQYIAHERVISISKRKEASDVDNLVSDLGSLTVNATSRDFHGFSATMSFTRLLKALAIRKQLPDRSDQSLPSRYITTPLVNWYFDNLFVMLPFFSETDFMSSLTRAYQDPQSLDRAFPDDTWIIRLVLAISAMSMSQYKGDEQYNTAISHITSAMKVSEYVIHPGAVSGVQALLLLVQYALLDPEHFDPWYLIGMAARLVIDLGLHCEPAPEAKISKHELDLRRRIFYCTYALDRLISMSLDRAFSFTDDSAPNVQLPTLATDQESKISSELFLRSVRPALYLFDVRRVQSAFYQRTRWSSRQKWSSNSVTEYVNATLSDVQAWHAAIPSSFSQRHLQIFQLEYLYSQVLIVSPNLVIPSGCLSSFHKSLLFNYAVEYSMQLRAIVSSHDTRPMLSFTDYERASYVATQFTSIVWESYDQILQSTHFNATHYVNCSNAINFIANIIYVFQSVQEKFGRSDLRERFQKGSAVLDTRLKNKQQELGSQQQQQQQQQHQQQQQQQNFYGAQNTNMPPTSVMMNFGASQSMMVSQSSYLHSPPLSSPPTTISPNNGTPTSGHSNAQYFEFASDTTHQSPQEEGNLRFLPAGSLPRRGYEFRGG